MGLNCTPTAWPLSEHSKATGEEKRVEVIMNQVQNSVLYPFSKVRPRVQRLRKRIRKGKTCRQEAQKLMHSGFL